MYVIINSNHTVIPVGSETHFSIQGIVGNIIIQLPPCGTIVGRYEATFKDADLLCGTYTVTILPFGAQTIDHVSNFVMNTSGESVRLRDNGTTNWSVIF